MKNQCMNASAMEDSYTMLTQIPVRSLFTTILLIKDSLMSRSYAWAPLKKDLAMALVKDLAMALVKDPAKILRSR